MPSLLHNSSHESLSKAPSEEAIKDKSANLDNLKEYWLEYCSAKVDKVQILSTSFSLLGPCNSTKQTFTSLQSTNRRLSF